MPVAKQEGSYHLARSGEKSAQSWGVRSLDNIRDLGAEDLIACDLSVRVG